MVQNGNICPFNAASSPACCKLLNYWLTLNFLRLVRRLPRWIPSSRKTLCWYECKVHEAHFLLVHPVGLPLGVRNLIVVNHQSDLISLLHREGPRAISHLGECGPILSINVQLGTIDCARAASRLIINEDV